LVCAITYHLVGGVVLFALKKHVYPIAAIVTVVYNALPPCCKIGIGEINVLLVG
jgi:hypothetical protein